MSALNQQLPSGTTKNYDENEQGLLLKFIKNNKCFAPLHDHHEFIALLMTRLEEAKIAKKSRLSSALLHFGLHFERECGIMFLVNAEIYKFPILTTFEICGILSPDSATT
ncbi:MAG: hypothetical protein FWB93_05660 [Oscillospiraceae bacterium]|nr:hypothetical protein [Oscillospiraceae bacterium]